MFATGCSLGLVKQPGFRGQTQGWRKQWGWNCVQWQAWLPFSHPIGAGEGIPLEVMLKAVGVVEPAQLEETGAIPLSMASTLSNLMGDIRPATSTKQGNSVK